MLEHTLEALEILRALGMPSAQINERSALTLLALLNLLPENHWSQTERPLMGITPIINWIAEHYGKQYAPNSRETIRKGTIHQFVVAGIVNRNPDMPGRVTNSPDTVYQIEDETLALLRTFGSDKWNDNLGAYINSQGTLAERYAKVRDILIVPIVLPDGEEIEISPGRHSELIREILEEFAPRFLPASRPVYIGDTADKWGYFDQKLLEQLGLKLDPHGKMPDVILYYNERKWLVIIESVTSHGPVDSKRHDELKELFSKSTAGLVFVTAFPDRETMRRYLSDISWETEVWVAESPDHLIHFNGDKFLGPYPTHRD